MRTISCVGTGPTSWRQVAIAAALIVSGLSWAASAGEDAPLLLRGGVAAESVAAEIGETGVMVRRGPGVVAVQTPMALPQQDGAITGGRSFWRFDVAEDRLVGCRLENTARVDGLRVRCAERQGLAPDRDRTGKDRTD